MPATERSYFGIQYDLKRNIRPFSADEIRALPSDAAGVYAIWIVEQLIYVGKATACIRTRLLSHLYNTDRSINPCPVRQDRQARDIRRAHREIHLRRAVPAR